MNRTDKENAPYRRQKNRTLNRAQLKLYHGFPLLCVGGCVGVSAVVSFGFVVGAGYDVRVTAGFAVGVELD
jgi:hypothetical protein